MTVRERLEALLDSLPEERAKEVLDFAEFLATRDDASDWREGMRTSAGSRYADDEPEYTPDDIKTS